MKALGEFTRTTLIGGVLIVLPIYVSILLLAKSLAIAVTLLAPVTAHVPVTMQFRHLIACIILIAVCFVGGIIVAPGRADGYSLRSNAICSKKFPVTRSSAG
jgi:hypothetical protein